MPGPDIKRKKLFIPDYWTVTQNRFMDLEPDNDFDIDLVWTYFDEDIFQATFNGYLIDLGFYGSYLDGRTGFFRIYVTKGDFLQGTLYESFVCRSAVEIVELLQQYIDVISNDGFAGLQGYDYSQEAKSSISDFDIYSAAHKIERKLSEDEFEKLSMPTGKV